MIPGWSRSAAEFGRNKVELAKGRRATALDMRGHDRQAETVIFEEDEGGGYFMFYEHAPRFNRKVAAYLPA